MSVKYLKSLQSIRPRCNLLLNSPEALVHFSIQLDQLDNVAEFILELIQRDYNELKDIKMHSRWRHFELDASQLGNKKQIKDRIGALLDSWSNIDINERVVRLLDLFVVSVLLDAGAGPDWKYLPENETVYYNRSEGLALASLDMFNNGLFSSDPRNSQQCDGVALSKLDFKQLQKGLQVSDDNRMVGLQGRFELLKRLGDTITKQHYFKKEGETVSRPGYLLYFLLSHSSTQYNNDKILVDINTLWEVIVYGLSDIWPDSRTKLGNTSLGDVWPCEALSRISQTLKPALLEDTESLVCFHKLSQWLCYSLMEPLSILNIEFRGLEDMTGLAEYRNGGLFIDMGVLVLKKQYDTIPSFNVYDDIVVEWRALTVALLDKVAELIRAKLGMDSESLSLAKVLEAGTWKAGREVAARKRADKGPPIKIISDGTVF